ncbi:SOS response-associated peptidase (plasmid) [Sphingomonas paeninsulae]|uniref:Abasic site processing protein n=1 Tax=Sphingomonas paeninsulae TaxID=2319844 RepID=A0A494TDH6_SPHPE|nr:SOS response-associated peptidase [Sphingomonas paeninsulae]AYJ85314.1 SOS response-associated peptidase [Sphingomonas paeninsulae]
MCGRYRDTRPWAELHAALREFVGPFDQPALNLESREQVRPTQAATIVRLHDAAPSVSQARWLLVPWFHKGALKDWKATTFNARAETVRTSRAYRDSFARRRCLIAADGWYEWKGEREDDPKKKQPWLFEPRHGEPIMLAGIWDRCETTDQGAVESFTVITQPAGAPLNAYHDRAPVVLFGQDWARWLDLDADIDDLLGPESADRFTVTKSAIR